MRGIKHGGKKGMRYRFKLSSVKRQNKKQKKKQRRITGSEAIDKAWDYKMTTRQNLTAMGIAYDPNEIQAADDIMEVDEFDLDQAKAIGSVQEQKRQGTRRKQRQSAAGSKNLKSGSKMNEGKSIQIIKQLEQVAKMESEEVEKRKRKQGKAKLQQNDVDFCEKMIAKYGVDFEAMSRDSLNIWQNGAGSIYLSCYFISNYLSFKLPIFKLPILLFYFKLPILLYFFKLPIIFTYLFFIISNVVLNYFSAKFHLS